MSGLFAHKGVRWIALGWTAFIAENLVLSESREAIIRSVGESNYRLAYGTLSTAACTTIFVGYWKHGRGQGPRMLPLRLVKSPLLQASAFAIQTAGLVCASQLFPTLQIPVAVGGAAKHNLLGDGPSLGPLTIRCPIDLQARDIPSGGGMKRITRHPQLWSMAFVALGAAIGTPFATEAILFAFPTIWAVAGGAHIDMRHRRGSGGALNAAQEDKTSHLPFLALLRGKQSWQALVDELKISNAALALAAGTLLAWRRGRRLQKFHT
jgi:protein-S-isoprenylcysteine O-methyltransferase Ste14